MNSKQALRFIGKMLLVGIIGGTVWTFLGLIPWMIYMLLYALHDIGILGRVYRNIKSDYFGDNNSMADVSRIYNPPPPPPRRRTNFNPQPKKDKYTMSKHRFVDD